MAKKILIVEDNPQNMDMIEMTLNSRDYVIVKAIDGEEALAVAERERPDLIIMDIQIPKINGLEVTRKLRVNPVFRHTPIIGVTAYAMKDDKEKVIAAGCDMYLPKPFSIHKLRDVVAEMLSQRQKDNPPVPAEVVMAKKTLIIDDDPIFLELAEQVLTHQGYEVLKADSGQEGLRLLFSEKPDLVLLDVVMPRMDGWQTCQRIREISDIPIIMLTGKQKAEEDIVRGLDCGADEYLFKPVGNRELVARVRAVLRRVESPSPTETRRGVIYADDRLTVDIAERKVMVKGKRVKLTPREFRLFALLVERSGRILTHKRLLERVWGWEYIDDLDYVRIYISHLRQKIEPDSTLPRYIITEPGVGYYFQKAG